MREGAGRAARRRRVSACSRRLRCACVAADAALAAAPTAAAASRAAGKQASPAPG